MNGCFPTVFPQWNVKCMLAQVPFFTVMSMIMNKNISENGTWEDMHTMLPKAKSEEKRPIFPSFCKLAGKGLF